MDRAAIRDGQISAMKQILDATGLKPSQLAAKAGVRPSTLNKPLGKGVKHVWSTSTIGKIVVHVRKHAKEYAENHPLRLPVEATLEKINAGVRALTAINPLFQDDRPIVHTPIRGISSPPSLGHNSSGVHDTGAETMGARKELMRLLIDEQITESTAAGILQIIKSYQGSTQSRPSKRGRT
jgi:hypothetical protein